MVDSVFGVTFSASSEAEIARSITDGPMPRSQGPWMVFTTNLDHVVTLSRNPALRRAYGRAWLVTADGMPVYLYAKSRGLAVPARVTGSGLCQRILADVAPGRHRLFFMVGSAETADAIGTEMRRRGFAPDALAFLVPPFGFEADEGYTRDVADSIGRHATTHLFMGVGSPKSEIWADGVRAALGDCYVLIFGAGLDYFAGTKTRAPKAMQGAGLEWAWRLASEPRRLASRYLVASWRFLWVVGRDLSGRGA